MGIKASLIAGAAALALPAPALAQAEVLMVGLCKRVTDDAARLKCFDAIGSTTEAGPKPPLPTRQEWRVTESKSAIDDSPQVAATLLSSDGSAGLILRCLERKTEAVILPNGLFAYETGKVLLRLNDLPATTATWPASSDYKAVFAPNGVNFVKLLPDNGKLFVRVTGRSKQADDATFELGEIAAVRDRIAAACKWQDTASIQAKQQRQSAPTQRP